MLAGVGVVPRRSCLIQRREYSTPPSDVRDKFECWRVVLFHDAHAVCVVHPHALGGTPRARFFRVRLSDSHGFEDKSMRIECRREQLPRVGS